MSISRLIFYFFWGGTRIWGGSACHTSPGTPRRCAWGTRVCLLLQGAVDLFIFFHFYQTVCTESCQLLAIPLRIRKRCFLLRLGEEVACGGHCPSTLPRAFPGCGHRRPRSLLGGRAANPSTCEPLASLFAGSSGAFGKFKGTPGEWTPIRLWDFPRRVGHSLLARQGGPLVYRFGRERRKQFPPSRP